MYSLPAELNTKLLTLPQNLVPTHTKRLPTKYLLLELKKLIGTVTRNFVRDLETA